MTVHLVTFSDESMSRARLLCGESALRFGVDSVFPVYADTVKLLPCYPGNESLFASKRGVGYWAWKAAIIEQMTDNVFGIVHDVHEGDVVIYSDAGVEFVNNVSHIIERMDQDIFLFGNNWEHAHWCKRDVIDAVWPQHGWNDAITEAGDQWSREPWQRFGKQVQASVIFFRVSDYTRKFVKEWLDWCLVEGGRLIDDSPSRLPNHPEFREHRHDQAILTTLAYREGIKLHWWPAVYNRGSSPEFVYEKLPEYAGDDYPVLFSHHRKRNHEWEAVA